MSNRDDQVFLSAAIAATHSELDRIADTFPDREDVAGRVRVARHQLRRIAGGDQSPDIMRHMAATIADLHRVTRGACTVSARGDHG